jgi:hypothetical protein
MQIEDLFRYNSSRKDLTLAYILTLGVVDSYRNLGIGLSPVSIYSLSCEFDMVVLTIILACSIVTGSRSG